MHRTTGTAIVAVFVACAGALASARGDVASGQRQLGQTIIEPAYDAATGEVVFLKTPIGASPANVDAHAISPLYLVVYPNSAAASVGTMICAHQPADNCPDHGPGISALAASQFAFYGPLDGSGVWGHDHLVVGHGPDANVVREIRVVLFTNENASHTHVTTADQVSELLAAGSAKDFVLGVIHASVVSEATYRRAIPLPPAILPTLQ